MWESISNILTSGNAWLVLILILIICILVVWSGKKGLFSIHTDKFTVGGNDRELTIVRNQSQWAYLFIMSLKGKIISEDITEIEKLKTEIVLEKVYDKVVGWITYNHITSSNSYIEIKQGEVRNFIYSRDNLPEQYKSESFETRMNEWVKELILNLLQIRKEYSNNR